MPVPVRQSGEAFALERLREDASLDFATLRAAARELGIELQPIQFGRARRQLGLTAAKKDDVPRALPAAADPTPDETPARPPAGRPRQGSPGFEFLVAELRADHTMSYRELRARAEARGLSVAPIMYGRAKAMLGLVPVKPRQARRARNGTAEAERPRTAPRTLKQVESVEADRFSKQLEQVRSIEELVAAVRALDAERRRLHALLVEIAEQIDRALGFSAG